MSLNFPSLHRGKSLDLRLLGSIWFQDISVLLSSIVTVYQWLAPTVVADYMSYQNRCPISFVEVP